MANISSNVVIAKAKSFVGIKESPANSNNVIFNTHYYGKAVSGSAYPWCAVFLWDVFRLCGASSLFYGGQKCAYTPSLSNYYKNQGRWYSTPKVGDLVFYQFSGSSRINHVGLVIEVLSNTKIRTIEGNTGSGNDANGGAVMIRDRATTYVKGYGRPAYATGTTVTTSAATATTVTTSAYTKKDFITDVQTALGGLTADGVAGPKTLTKTITVSATKNKNHAVVKPIQKYLNAIGYSCGTADGVAGSKFTSAVKKFQTAKGCTSDGEITAKAGTWKALLGL